MDTYEFIMRNGRQFFNTDGDTDSLPEPKELNFIRIMITEKLYRRGREYAKRENTSIDAVLRQLVCEGLLVDEDEVENSKTRGSRGGVAMFYLWFGDIAFQQEEIEECEVFVQEGLRELLATDEERNDEVSDS